MSSPIKRASASAPITSDFKPLSELLPIETVDSLLTGPGSPFEITYELIDGRIQAVLPGQKIVVRDALLGSLKMHARRTHIVYGPARMTFQDTHDEAMRLANALRIDYGVRKGDRVAIISRNTPHFIVTAVATFILGALLTPINAFAEAPTLAYCIQDSNPRVVICDVERWHRLSKGDGSGDMLRALVKSAPALQALIVSPWKSTTYLPRSERDWLQSSSALAVADWDDAFERAAAYPPFRLPALRPEDDAMIMYTSGTTGMPKGVLSNQRQIMGIMAIVTLHLARGLIRRGQEPPLPPGPEVVSEDECPSGLLLSPLFHISAMFGWISATLRGSKMVFLPGYSAQGAIEAIKRERVKAISAVGFMVREIFSQAKEGELDSIEAVSHGGASSASDIPAGIQKRAPGAISANGYGATELSGLIVAAVADEYVAHPGTIGHPLPSVEVRVLDPDTGRIIDDDTPGELLIRSPCNAKGYWRKPKETAAAFLQDGFFRTGDLVRRDAESGYLFLVDRIKDMIIRGGENISCAAVETAVYADSRVLECAAVGIPDDRLGERVAIVITTSPQHLSTLTPQAVQDVVRTKGLPKFAVPEVVWVRTEALEKNANGKVVKRSLREEVVKWMKAQGRPSKL
ncbi:hypothetical protein OC842_000291 [Tilletia horrida]|uniref:AMP-dependent synthetase/ligase domain-containing protein n=1 Tax=Tilletia horrida TaxID=155126 RepID=A0AAN6GJL2_9BASI|nr:hypothetical protein OC842_000291 [Tilletia horrida]